MSETVPQPIPEAPKPALNIRPGMKWFWIALLIFFLGVSGIAFELSKTSGPSWRQFKFVQREYPGEWEVDLPTEGKYFITYIEYKNWADWAKLDKDSEEKQLSGLLLKLFDISNQTELNISKPDRDTGYGDPNGLHAYPIASVMIGHPGRYRVTAYYEDGRKEPRVTLSVNEDYEWYEEKWGHFSTPCMVMIFLSSLFLFVIPFLRRRNRKDLKELIRHRQLMANREKS